MNEVKIKENIIGKNIKQLRLQNNLTQTQLGEMLGGTKSLICNYETGYSLPDIYMLIRLADIFDVSLDELVGRS